MRNRAALSEFEYLVLGDKDRRIGALGFGKDGLDPGTFHESSRELMQLNNLQDLMDAARAVESLDDLEPAQRQYLIRGSSLGGARPKMTADWQGGQWIAKFQRHDDTIDMPRIELRLCH
jgi:serine/threonine-protein kinase HipA